MAESDRTRREDELEALKKSDDRLMTLSGPQGDGMTLSGPGQPNMTLSGGEGMTLSGPQEQMTLSGAQGDGMTLSGPQIANNAQANERSHFFSVANSLLAALAPVNPQIMIPERLKSHEAEAVRNVYEARVDQESEIGPGQLSGLERMRHLNSGLQALQNVLALARSPEFLAARGHIEELRRRIGKLRDEIQSQIIADEIRKRKEQDKKKAGLQVEDDKNQKNKTKAGPAKV